MQLVLIRASSILSRVLYKASPIPLLNDTYVSVLPLISVSSERDAAGMLWLFRYSTWSAINAFKGEMTRDVCHTSLSPFSWKYVKGASAFQIVISTSEFPVESAWNKNVHIFITDNGCGNDFPHPFLCVWCYHSNVTQFFSSKSTLMMKLHLFL